MAGKFIAWKANEPEEIPRTYLVRDRSGKEFYKMYKPSETKEIFRRKGWTGRIVSIMGVRIR